MNITALTGPGGGYQYDEVGAQAAAAAVNRAGGINGRPLKVITCDDGFDPNKAEACAREGVADHVVALVGCQSAEGDKYLPIFAAAGIPEVGEQPNSATEATSPDSYPLIAWGTTPDAGYAAFFKALGVTKVAVPYVNLAAAQAILTVLQTTFKADGLQMVPVPVDPTATDMTTYLATALSSHPGGIYPILPTNQVVGLLQAVKAQGVDLTKTALLNSQGIIGPDITKQFAPSDEGMYMTGSFYPSADTSAPGVAEFNAEINAYGDHGASRNDTMTLAWESVHFVADQLKKLPTISAAALVAQLKQSGPQSLLPGAPFNLDQLTVPNSPLREFSTEGVFGRVHNGVESLLTPQFVDLTNPSGWISGIKANG